MYATMRASLWAPALGLISIAMGTRAGLGGRQVSTFGRTIRAVKSALGPLAGFLLPTSMGYNVKDIKGCFAPVLKAQVLAVGVEKRQGGHAVGIR